ncbi:MAG: energy transducer TonB [Acidobacteriota bacterium]
MLDRHLHSWTLVIAFAALLTACSSGTEPPRGWQQHARGDIGKTAPPAEVAEVPDLHGDGFRLVWDPEGRGGQGVYQVDPAPSVELPTAEQAQGEITQPVSIERAQPRVVDYEGDGSAIVTMIVDREGLSHPVSVALMNNLPNELAVIAIETARTWRFEPATSDGEPVAIIVSSTMSFAQR